MKVNPKTSSVLVTGGTSGLGLEIARLFLERGHKVVICGRDKERLSVALKSLSIYCDKQQLFGLKCDVADLNMVYDLKTQISLLGLDIDVLIANAGIIGPIEPFLDNDLRMWQDAFNVNFYGTLNLVRVFLPPMLESSRGRVVHVSGGGATSPLFGMTSYAASKVAAVRFIESLSLEYSKFGVTFNSVSPGILKTRLLDQMLEAGPERVGDKLFTKSLSKSNSENDSTSSATELIYFLTLPEADFITGKLISAEWDNWQSWRNHLHELQSTDIYTIRRITGRDRGFKWGDL